MKDISHIIPKYTEKDIAEFENESFFMEASVELYKQTIELIWILLLKYCDQDENPKLISKDDAVIAGNLVRLNKLNLSFLQNICEMKSEICFILNRCIAETIVNLEFLLIEGEERVKRNYIKNSLITEKELWETILSNIQKRNGEILPIEKRMQLSIEKSFDSSDFEIDEVCKSSKWKTLKARADVVANEMFYIVYYGLSSHAIHGNWQDLLFNHLEKVENGFKINYSRQIPRPQIINGVIFLNLEIIELFTDKEIDDEFYQKELKNTCQKLRDYLSILNNYHEDSINKTSR